MDLSKLSDDELIKLYQSTKSSGVGQATMAPNFPNPAEIPNALDAARIGAGRTFDRIGAGVKQVGLSGLTAARELSGGDTGTPLRDLAALDKQQSENARLYEPLAKQYPLSTAIGENAILMPTPMGATTAARIGIPAAAGAVLGATEYGSPQERAARALFNGASAAGGGLVGEAVGRAVSPAASSLTKRQQDVLGKSVDNLGVTPLPSQLTGNQNLSRLEDYLRYAPGSSNVFAQFDARNRAAINRAAGGAIKAEMDPGSPALTPDVVGPAKKAIAGRFDELRAGTTMPVTGDVLDAIDSASAFLGKGSTQGKQEALTMLKELKDKLYGTKEIDGQDYQAWSTSLSDLRRSTTNGTVRAALKQVESAMDKTARGSNAPAWQEADKNWAALKTLLQPGVVNEATGDVNPVRLGTVLGQRQNLGDAMKLGNASGPLVDIAEYGKAFPPSRMGSPTAPRQEAGSIMGWVKALANYPAAKVMTSQAGRDWLSSGLLGNPAMSEEVARLIRLGVLPATAALEGVGATNMGLLGVR